jgi:hypothetical protein
VKVGNDPAAARRAVKLETASIITHPGGKVDWMGVSRTRRGREGADGRAVRRSKAVTTLNQPMSSVIREQGSWTATCELRNQERVQMRAESS